MSQFRVTCFSLTNPHTGRLNKSPHTVHSISRDKKQGHRRFPSDPLGSRYQRGPERYSLSVGLSRVSERFGSMWAQATCIALIKATGATYEVRNDGVTTEATR